MKDDITVWDLDQFVAPFVAALTLDSSSAESQEADRSPEPSTSLGNDPGTVTLQYYCSDMDDGREVAGAYHDESFWWRFRNGKGGEQSIRLSHEAMRRVTLIYSWHLRQQTAPEEADVHSRNSGPPSQWRLIADQLESLRDSVAAHGDKPGAYMVSLLDRCLAEARSMERATGDPS
jgi:hypothetical protein